MDESDTRGLFTAEQMPEAKTAKLSRRHFLKVTLLAGAGALAAGCAPASTAEQAPVVPQELPQSLDAKYPEVPSAPASPPPFAVYRFFTSEEAATVEALTARI